MELRREVTEKRRCEVCGRKLKKYQKYYCSPRCKTIAQTREWKVLKELRKTGRVTLLQLTQIVKKQLGRKNVGLKIARIIELANEVGERVEIVVGGRTK